MSEGQSANRLIHEKSPYLLQHAHNPVDWFPWGDEAFALAKKTNKPLLVSIGYATCHWCHVMERESFEDPKTAELINRYFVADQGRPRGTPGCRQHLHESRAGAGTTRRLAA